MVFSFAFAALSVSACSTYKDELARGQNAFEQTSYERALAVFRALEADNKHLDPAEQTRYAYLRGMTDHKMGYRSDARHWLLVAKALESNNPGSLPSEWKTRLDEAVVALNETVYQTGIASLTNNRRATTDERATDEPAAAPSTPKKKAKSEDEP